MNTHEEVTISITIPVSIPPERWQKIREAFAINFPGATLDFMGGESGKFTIDRIEFPAHHPFANDGNVTNAELVRAKDLLESLRVNRN